MAIKTVEERAAAGAKFLDEEQPGWAAKINLDLFDMGVGCSCALAQAKGTDYIEACSILELDIDGGQVIELGFYPSSTKNEETDEWDDEASDLTAAWKVEISQRILVPA